MIKVDNSGSNPATEILNPGNPKDSVSNLFIQQSTDILFVHCKANGEIINTNKGFRKKFHYQPDASSSTLFSFLSFNTANKSSFDKGLERTTALPELFYDNQTQAPLLFYVYQRNDEFFLFGLSKELGQSKETELLSSLTTDMGNLLMGESRANRKLSEAYEKIKTLSRIDTMTGILNHSYFVERSEEILSHAKRHNRSICLIMSDIDLFKNVNDQFGHQTGDKVLAGVGKILNDLTRAGDVSARYGGEEFVTLLQDASIEQAAKFAERIRATFEASCPVGPEHPITISLGVANLEAGDTLDSLVKKADDALYQAKETGRNKVCIFKT